MTNNNITVNFDNTKDNFTSLELVDLINKFREQEKNKNKLRHDTMLSIIREEFQEEISLQKILESKYTNERGREYPMFILDLKQSRQVLVKESRVVRKAVIEYIDKLEEKLQQIKQTYFKQYDFEIDNMSVADKSKWKIEQFNKIKTLADNLHQDTSEVQRMILFIIYKAMEKADNIDFTHEQAKYNYKICVYVNQPRINVVSDSLKLRKLFTDRLDKVLNMIKSNKMKKLTKKSMNALITLQTEAVWLFSCLTNKLNHVLIVLTKGGVNDNKWGFKIYR